MKTKKELKGEYKEMKFPMGVFQIKNSQNNKVLIDSSLNMTAKWNRHHVQLKFGSHRNINLQADWKKYGAEAFKFEILEEVAYKESRMDYAKEVKALLELYLEEIQPFGEKGYNN